MLHLAAATEPEWAERALENLEEILIDHAHCELKAASTALGLVFRYSQHAALAAPLSAFAREELEHFEAVVGLLERRGFRFRGLGPSSYARRLRTACREREPGQLTDTLLACALIEARSCERFQLLAERARDRDPELADFYGGLLASEARHHADFIALAHSFAPRDEVRDRLAALADHEARVLADSPGDVPRLHNGGVAAAAGAPTPRA